jgi:3-phenylpropionate/trans-cinnamate dioxygenase ferredoxin component
VAFHLIARAEDVPPGQTRFFCIDGRPLVIAHYSGQLYALAGLCPHKGFELHGAILWDHLITCPWHQFQYDVRTGENYFPKNVYPSDLGRNLRPLETYRIELRGSEIWVDLA